MRVPFVDLARQNAYLREHLITAFVRVMDSGRYLMGPEVEAFERDFAERGGQSYHSPDFAHAIAVSSGTDACELAIRAAGWSGCTVATPAFGAVPTIAAIEAAGADPVLVDVDQVTRGVSFETLAQVRTDGAIVVHMFGELCDVPAEAIEDCAHAQGASDGRHFAGQQGIAAAFSTFPTKCLGGLGDGGVVTTRSAEIASRVRALRHYGGLLDGDVSMRGQNSRLSELGAALLGVKLWRLSDWNRQRREIAARYFQELEGKVTLPHGRRHSLPSYHCFVIEHAERDRIKAALEARGIGCMIHYPRPLHFYRRWRHLGAPGDFPVAEKLAATVLSLPCFPGLTEAEQTEVIAAVKDLT